MSENHREDFGGNEKSLAEVQAEKARVEAQIAELTAQAETLATQETSLQESQNEMLAAAQEEATVDNTEFDAAQEEAVRIEEEQAAAAAEAEKQSRLAELRKNIIGETSVEDQSESETSAEVALPTEERLDAPKSEMFEKYGEKMRTSAQELVDVKKQMSENRIKMNDESLDMTERLKAQEENKVLNDRRNELRNAATADPDFRRQKIGESYGEYSNYQSNEMDAYMKAALEDPDTALLMIESGELGNGYQENKGIGSVSQKLRGNLEFMQKALEKLPSGQSSENFYVHVTGEARQDKELYLNAIRKNHLNYQWGSDEWKIDPEVQKVARESGLDEMYLKK